MNLLSRLKRSVKFFLKKKINLNKVNSFKNLDQLFKFYKTDKSSEHHGFFEFYEYHLHSLKNEKINIVEIGSAKGASAAAFYSYFNDCRIFCLDNHIENFKYKSKYIHPILIDCSQEVEIEKFYRSKKLKLLNIDLLIDDGSHRLDDIIKSIKFHFKKIKSKGYYIIEDYLHPNYYDHCSNNSEEIKIDQLLKNIKNKTKFSSKILSYEFQDYLFENVEEIKTYKGKMSDSDICFIKKK